MSTEIKKIIDEVTEETFNVIKQVYDYQRESNPRESKTWSEVGTRIIFPKYSEHRKSKGIDRISEQELRFVFIEQLILYANKKNLDICYSVETPTDGRYRFSGVEHPEESDIGVSARIDLSIYDEKFKRICLIEFKALNPELKNYEKDILKLKQETSVGLKYFIQIIKNYNKGTIDSLKKKTVEMNNTDIQYRCFCLQTGEKIKL